MKLYNFSNLAQKLTSMGFAELSESRFQIVRKDLSEEISQNKVRFGEDGIYLNINGIDHKGYMYLKVPGNIEVYGNPKFHIIECQTINNQREAGTFNGRYFWHNSNVVSLYNRAGSVIRENQVLELCGNCRNAAQDLYTSTEGFFNLLDIQDQNCNTDEEADFYGYVKDWRQISSRFRKENNHQCNNCNIRMINRLDYRFIQVHHKSGEKKNNRRENLECLCCLCHANVDAHHHENFKTKNNSAQIIAFVKKFKKELLECNNPYVFEFLKNHLL